MAAEPCQRQADRLDKRESPETIVSGVLGYSLRIAASSNGCASTGTHHRNFDAPKPGPERFRWIRYVRRTLSRVISGGAAMTTTIGYARVSRHDQDPSAQDAELRAAGAERVFVDRGESSRVKDRPQWIVCLDYMRAGDTLLVRRLDRLAGSEKMAIETINELHERGVNIKSLTEPDIDTTTPMGRALFGIVAVFAQLRVDTIRDNTRRGLAHARAEGRIGGRPSVMTAERLVASLRMREQGQSTAHIARVLGVGASSVARAFAKADADT